MLANLTPAQEPVGWYAALAILLNALLVGVFVFAPRDGINFSGGEQAALVGITNGIYLFVGAIFTRQSTTPTAPPPAPAPVVVPPPSVP